MNEAYSITFNTKKSRDTRIPAFYQERRGHSFFTLHTNKGRVLEELHGFYHYERSFEKSDIDHSFAFTTQKRLTRALYKYAKENKSFSLMNRFLKAAGLSDFFPKIQSKILHDPSKQQFHKAQEHFTLVSQKPGQAQYIWNRIKQYAKDFDAVQYPYIQTYINGKSLMSGQNCNTFSQYIINNFNKDFPDTGFTNPTNLIGLNETLYTPDNQTNTRLSIE